MVSLSDVPQCNSGAPLPVVVADEGNLVLAYVVNEPDPNWDGTYATAIDPSTPGLLFAIVTFQHPRAHFSGPPNDEAFSGHPLHARGLRPYAAFEVENSSWVRALEHMNRVHPNHSPRLFTDLKHFIFAFHDSVFECIARGYSVTLHRCSRHAIHSLMLEHLRRVS